MIISKHRFSLEIQSAHSQIAVPVTLGDTGTAFYITLTDGGNPFYIPEGTLAMLTIHRPTGTYLQAFCTIKNNTTIIYDFMQNENSAVVEGIHTCALTLYGGQTGSELSTSWFTMTVNARVVNNDNINITDEDKSSINAMIGAEATRQDNEVGRINAESLRADAETARVLAESARENAVARAIEELNTEVATVRQLRQSGALNGSPGRTPVKYVDYFTESDIEDIVERVLAVVPAAEVYDGSVVIV